MIMKLKISLLSIVCLLFSISNYAQNEDTPSTYDLRFANPQLDCEASPVQFCITLQIKASENAADFAVGAHTFFFLFNNASIGNSTYEPYIFNNTNTCTEDDKAPYSEPRFCCPDDPNIPKVNISTNMTSPNKGCPTISSEWVDVGVFCSEVLNPLEPVQIEFDKGLTLLNLNSNWPEHQQGNLERFNFFPSCSTDDTDGDGLTDDVETALGTDINNKDSDGDGLEDGDEVLTYYSDPLKEDGDDDGLSDADEINIYGTEPGKADTDGDGLNDFEEIFTYDTDPFNPDTDGDGLFDGREIEVGSDPFLEDTDEDGLTDGREVNFYGSNPTEIDTDGDGLADGVEVNDYNTNPTIADTDSDGLTDNEEVNIYFTEPLVPDTDDDGLKDGEEVEIKSDPLDEDTDDDGINDSVEVLNLNTDPLDADTDDDTIPDGEEYFTYGTDPGNADSDGDLVSDQVELVLVNDSTLLDTDGDGTANILDKDDDGDNIFTADEDVDGDGDPTNDDTDLDEEPNYLDKDDDGDGIVTAREDNNNDGDYTNDDDDGDGIPDYLDADALNIDEITPSNKKIQLFPNPITHQLNLQITDSQPLKEDFIVHFFNTKGQLIKEVSTSKANLSIDVSDFTKGLYTIAIIQNGQTVYQEKFVKY